MLPERLLVSKKCSQVLLGSSLLSPTDENTKSVSPGHAGRKAYAHKHCSRFVARQLLLLVFPNL